MPTYDYVCENCGHHFEKFQSITAAPLTECPECQGHVRRLISAGNGFLFKGSGFYETDYRSESYKRDKKKAEGTKSKTTAKSKPAKTDKKLPQNAIYTVSNIFLINIPRSVKSGCRKSFIKINIFPASVNSIGQLFISAG